MMDELLRVDSLHKAYPMRHPRAGGPQTVNAVDGVSFSVLPGETLGLVGESGCGKSTLARLVLRLVAPDRGHIWFDGVDLAGLRGRQLRSHRSRMQMIFQNPYESLNPRQTVAESVGAPLEIHTAMSRAQRQRRVEELVEQVGLKRSCLDRFPHEFSGGQRQRIGIARAIALSPRLIVCDEPVSALDVSVQAQILNLLARLQQDLGLTYIFISHNLSVVKYMSTRVAVMYLGGIVEIARAETLYRDARHPYTRLLLDSIPLPTAQACREVRSRPVEMPVAEAPVGQLAGCRFAPRCPHGTELCATVPPALRELGGDHWVSCHRYPLREGGEQEC